MNQEDHVKVIAFSNKLKKCTLVESFKAVQDILQAISNKRRFSYDSRYGYITTCPTNLGSGFSASITLKVNNLCQNLDILKKHCEQYKVDFTIICCQHIAKKDLLSINRNKFWQF